MSSAAERAPVFQNEGKSSFEKFLGRYGIAAAFLFFALIYSAPTAPGLTVQGKIAAAVFFSALILWVSESIPTYATALLVVVMLAVTGAWDEKSILGVFGYDVIWLMVSAFMITSAMEKTGVAKRLALFLVSRFGETAKRALLGMIFANFILAFIIPSTTARAIVLFPIAIPLLQAYGAIPGKSNFGRLLMIQELQANNIFTAGVLTATAPQIMAVGYLRDLGGIQVSWLQWLAASMPIAFLTMLFSYLIGFVLFPPEVQAPRGEGIEEMRKELASMGRLTSDEWKAIGLFVLTVFLWASGPYHTRMFGLNISLVMTAIISATLAYLTGLLSWKETKIPWDLMIFSCGAYAAGTALEKSGAASWALDRIFAKVNPAAISFPVIFAIVIFLSSFSHMVFTSKTVRTVILIPTIIGLAKATGYNPAALALPAAFTIADSITLPPNCKPNLIFYSAGQFTVLNQFLYGVVVLAAKCLLLLVASFTLFRWLGISIRI